MRKPVSDWLKTEAGTPRGYIQPASLDELWFHTGTNCNLRCPFCLEGSKPGDNRIEFITLAEATPLIEEALQFEVKEFSFTGGEPFLNPHMVPILETALQHRPCLVLTNATEPLMNRLGEVKALRDLPHELSLRVSLDFPDPARHDEGRGRGNFRKSLRCLKQLHELGFHISIARLMAKDEDTAATNAEYLPYFREVGLPDDTRIVVFPDFKPPNSEGDTPEITESCMTTYLTGEQRAAFMCNFSKMIVKINGKLGIYACTLVDDDVDYDLGATLKEAMEKRVMMKHHRCFACFAYGASCSEIK